MNVTSKIIYTDYPFTDLGDKEFEKAPIREARLISFDGDKYVTIYVNGTFQEVKAGYIYTKFGRHGDVPVAKLDDVNVSVGNKELDELREKAEAFDFLSGMGEFQFMPSPEYCSLFNDEESSVTEGDNLLDCVKQARECEG